MVTGSLDVLETVGKKTFDVNSTAEMHSEGKALSFLR